MTVLTRTRRAVLVVAAVLLAIPTVQPQNAAEPAQQTPGEAYASMGFGVFMHYGLATFVGRTPWDYDPHNIAPTVYDPPDFDADQWMDAIAASGATYIVLTAKHHDGFVMWPSAYTDWGVETSSDPDTDVVGEVVDAAREHGLKVALYYSWFDKREPGGHVTQNPNRITESPAYLAYAKNQITELLTGYGPVEALWLDIAPIDDEQLPELAAHVHSVSPDTAFIPNPPPTYRETPEPADVRPFLGPGETIPCEYEEPAEQANNVSGGPGWWQTNDRPPRADTEEVVSALTYTRSLGATLSLNVSPSPSGQLPPVSVRLLEAIGDRLRGDDLVADAPTAASDAGAEHPAGHATDLLAKTHWQVPSGTDFAWLQVDLPEPMTIDRTVVQFTAEGVASGYEIQYQDDEGAWRTAHVGGVPSFPSQTDVFRAVTTSRLRVVVEGAGDGLGLAEFKAYGGVDDTGSAVTYDGTGWQAQAVPSRPQARPPSSDGLAGAFNQSVHRSRTEGDTATIAFRGNGVELRTRVGPDQGIARVSVDGGAAQTVDLYEAEADADAAVFEQRDLAPGDHTLTVEVTGNHRPGATGSWVTLDRITPLALAFSKPYEVLPDGRLIYDDSGSYRCADNSPIEYSGSWSSDSWNGANNDTRHFSREPGDYAELTFTGTGVAVMTQTRPGHGIAAISVDGGPAELVDTYSNPPQEQVIVWERTGLEPAEHTVRIEVTGDSNPASRNRWVALDAIVVTP